MKLPKTAKEASVRMAYTSFILFGSWYLKSEKIMNPMLISATPALAYKNGNRRSTRYSSPDFLVSELTSIVAKYSSHGNIRRNILAVTR